MNDGVAGALLAAMLEEGVDPSDPAALERWMNDFNSRSLAERDRIVGPAIVARGGPPLEELIEDDGSVAAVSPFRDMTTEEFERFAAELDAEMRAAREILYSALAEERGKPAPEAELKVACRHLRRGFRAGGQPFDWIRAAAGVRREARRPDEELIVECLAGTMFPGEETGLDPRDEAAIMSLDDADWLGALLSAARAGPGSAADPRALVAGISACPEVDMDLATEPGDRAIVEAIFALVIPAWKALGVVDANDRLTALGAWALPRALALGLGGDFDAE